MFQKFKSFGCQFPIIQFFGLLDFKNSPQEKYAPTEVIPIYKGKAGTACRRMTHATDDAFEVYCKGQQADSFTMAGDYS